MEGVVLFADDKVHHFSQSDTGQSNENALFQSLCIDLPVLGVNSLALAQKTLAAVGAFSAIILDWQFDEDDDALSSIFDSDDETTGLVRRPSSKEEATKRFLEDNDIYSLIYVFSEKDVEAEHGEWLKNKFGDRIQIEQKGNLRDVEAAKTKILADIAEWKVTNRNLSIPLLWSAAINKSAQKIFKDLSEADPNWLKEIYESAKGDGVSPELFVIEIFQGLLSENLVQAKELLEAIEDYSANEIVDIIRPGETKAKSIAKLFSRLFYSQVKEETPIMTGDICQISEDTFGIIISPECDIKKICESPSKKFDILVFKTDSFDNFLINNYPGFSKALFDGLSDSKKDKMRKMFNPGESKFHILPSFPLDGTHSRSVIVDLSNDCHKISNRVISRKKRPYKLNSPFIQQLRQRYLAHIGRVGVPTLPESLRDFNLKPS